MNPYEFGPIAALLDGAYSLVMALTDLVEPVAGGAAAALAVILLTLGVRVLLVPVGISQAKAQRMRKRLAPKLAELRRRYEKKPEVLQRKTMELYAEEGANPLAGCLPLLLQAPVISLVYGIFILPTINGHANALLDFSLAGVPLGSSFAHGLVTASVSGASLLVFGLIIAGIGIIAWFSRMLQLRLMGDPTAAAADAPPALQRMTGVLSFAPFITAVIAAFVPLAASLYLLTTVTWTLGERWILSCIIRDEPVRAVETES